MINIQDILQAKYELGGRGPDCYDCYGLVREMYRRCGKEIPNYYGDKDFEKIAIKVNEETNRPNTKWRKITKNESTRTIKNAFGEVYLRPNCIIVLRVGRFGCHVGFILNELQFIHCWEKANGAIIDRIDLWKHNILGAYDYDLCIGS